MTSAGALRAVIHLQGGSRVGMGHVHRMEWLARELGARGMHVAFLLRGDAQAVAIAKATGIPVHAAPLTMPARAVVEQYVAANAAPAIWINDCLRVDAAVHQAVKRRGIPVVSLDDAGDGLSPEDVVINAMPSFWRDALSTRARMLQGPAYMIMDPQVARWAAGRTLSAAVRRAAVTFGGSDPHGLLLRVLDQIAAWPQTVEWHLYVGPLFRHARALAAWRARHGELPHVRWHVGERDVLAQFAQADLAICSAGHTLFEMLGMGTPTIVIPNAPHEQVNGQYFAAQGACRLLGTHRRVDGAMISRAVQTLLGDVMAREWLARRGRLLVDGRGLQRVVDAIMETATRRDVLEAQHRVADAPTEPAGVPDAVWVTNDAQMLVRWLRRRPAEIRLVVLDESVRAQRIRALLAPCDIREHSRTAWVAARGDALRQAYVQCLADLNWRHDALFWRAMPFTNKNLLSMSLCQDVSSAVLCMELARQQRGGVLVVVTDSADVAGQLRAWGRTGGLRVQCAVRDARRVRQAVLRWLPLGVLYGWLRTCVMWWLARRHWRDVSSQIPCDVVTTAFPPSSATAEGWREAYFGPLPSFLAQQGRRVLLYGLCFGRPVATLRAMQRQRLTDVTYVPAESCLRLRDLARCAWEAVGQWMRPARLAGPVTLLGYDVSFLVQQAVRESRRSTSLFHHLCIYRSTRRLAQQVRVERWFYPFENRAWEKMVLTGVRQVAPATRCIGYQHAAVSPGHLNYVLGQDEELVTPLPDRIVTVGELTQQWLTETGRYPATLLELGCALRQAAPPAATTPRRSLQRVLVVLASSAQEYRQTYQFVRDALRGGAYTVRFRPHPEFAFERILQDLLEASPWYECSRAPLAEDLAWADVVLGVSSTVVVEALSRGLPVVRLELGELISSDPLFGWEALKWSVAQPAQLSAALRAIDALPAEAFASAQAQAREHTARYLRPVTDERLQEFANV